VGSWTTQNVATAIQDVLICIEMMIIAFIHRHAFSYEPYIGAPSLRTTLLEDHFAHHSALKDFNEVMPVLLPSHFRPGPALTTDRALLTRDELEAQAGDRAEVKKLRRGVSDGIEIVESSIDAIADRDDGTSETTTPLSPVNNAVLTSSLEKLPWRL